MTFTSWVGAGVGVAFGPQALNKTAKITVSPVKRVVWFDVVFILFPFVIIILPPAIVLTQIFNEGMLLIPHSMGIV